MSAVELASIRKRCLLNSGREMKKSTASRKAEWLQMPGSQSEETATFATVTDTEFKESEPFSDVEEDR